MNTIGEKIEISRKVNNNKKVCQIVNALKKCIEKNKIKINSFTL